MRRCGFWRGDLHYDSSSTDMPNPEGIVLHTTLSSSSLRWPVSSMHAPTIHCYPPRQPALVVNVSDSSSSPRQPAPVLNVSDSRLSVPDLRELCYPSDITLVSNSGRRWVYVRHGNNVAVEYWLCSDGVFRVLQELLQIC